MLPNNPELDGFDWSVTTFEGARREQLRHWATLSLRQIVEAQEEMQDLYERFAQERNSGADPADTAK